MNDNYNLEYIRMERRKIFKCNLRFNMSNDGFFVNVFATEYIIDLMEHTGFINVKCIEEDTHYIVMDALASKEVVENFEKNKYKYTEEYDRIEYIEVFKQEMETIPFYPHLESYFNRGAWNSYLDVLKIEDF